MSEGGWMQRGRVVIAGVAVLAVLIAVLVARNDGSGGGTLAANGSDKSSTARPGQGADSGGSDRGGAGTGTVKAGSGGTGAAASGDAALPGGGGVTELPLTVKASDTDGLKDGDEVKIHVAAKEGSAVYAVEAYLCKGNTSYTTDADIRPSWTGKCASKPLSAASEQRKEVPSAPPYKTVDAVFRVGTGTDTYQDRFGNTRTITCDAANPCALVLKLQFPNGYGFDTLPLKFKEI